MMCWDGKCEEGTALCCRYCEKYNTCTDVCSDNCGGKTMKWIYIGDSGVTGMDTYRCSECCCLIHVEGDVLPKDCPNCGAKSFDEEAKTKIEWISAKEAKPKKSGVYLCWTRYGAMVLPFSVKYNAFNTRDNDKEVGTDLEVKAWALPLEGPEEK